MHDMCHRKFTSSPSIGSADNCFIIGIWTNYVTCLLPMKEVLDILRGKGESEVLFTNCKEQYHPSIEQVQWEGRTCGEGRECEI